MKSAFFLIVASCVLTFPSLSVAQGEPEASMALGQLANAKASANSAKDDAALAGDNADDSKGAALSAYATYKVAHGGMGNPVVDAMFVNANADLASGNAYLDSGWRYFDGGNSYQTAAINAYGGGNWAMCISLCDSGRGAFNSAELEFHSATTDYNTAKMEYDNIAAYIATLP